LGSTGKEGRIFGMRRRLVRRGVYAPDVAVHLKGSHENPASGSFLADLKAQFIISGPSVAPGHLLYMPNY